MLPGAINLPPRQDDGDEMQGWPDDTLFVVLLALARIAMGADRAAFASSAN